MPGFRNISLPLVRLSDFDNESVSQILRKGYLLFVALLREFISQVTRPPRRLGMPNYRRGVVLVMVLLVMNNLVIASTAGLYVAVTSLVMV